MKLRIIVATAATAAVLASSGVAIAGATSGSDSPATPTGVTAAAERPAGAKTAHARRFKVRRHLRRIIKGAGGVVTKTIGIDRKTLRQELRSGKTIAQIATDHNANPQDVIDALVAAADKRLDTAVANGRIPAERAAKIKERLPDRITKLVNNWHPKHFRAHAAG
jgi:ribosomal protein S20